MTDESKPATSGVRLPPPAFFALGLAGGFLAHWLRPTPIWPEHALDLRTIAILLVVAGIGTAVWAVLTFRAAGTSPNPTKPTTALAADGPYRFSRNPMYLGLAAASAGFAIFWNALWPLLSVPIAMIFLARLVIFREERYLEATFGEEYLRYTDRVRRWI